MVKVYGPLMSMRASGKLADAIVFSEWKGRAYVRQLVTPANPRSGGQVGMRSMFSGLAKAWSGFIPTWQAYWNDLATAGIISPFNAWVQFNQNRWAQYKAPTWNPEDVGEDSVLPSIGAYTAVGGVRSATISITITVANDALGLLVHRSATTPYDSAISNLVYAKIDVEAATYVWIDSPLDAGTYYYNLQKTGLNGNKEIIDVLIPAVVTDV